MQKTIFFDIDNTLTTDNSWERLNLAAGLTPDEDYVLYQKFHHGDITYNDWTKQLEKIYKEKRRLTMTTATKALQSFKLRPDSVSTVTYLKAQNYQIVLLTGGFKETAKTLADELKLVDFLYVSDIEFDDNGNFGRLLSLGNEVEQKVRLAKEYCHIHSIKLGDTIAVGDSDNDIQLFNLVGRSFAFDWCKLEVKNNATDIIEKLADLQKIL